MTILVNYNCIILQFHWNNPQKRSDYFDGSGLRLYYTPNKRIDDAGVLTIGQSYFEIPPRREEVIVTGQCDSPSVNGTVYLTRAINHMHYLGKIIGHIEILEDRSQTGYFWLTLGRIFGC
jgi:dopamine beta-monooxygenase